MRTQLGYGLLAVLALSGCSGAAAESAAPSGSASAAPTTATATPKPSPTVTATKKAATREEQVKEIYLDAIHKAHPALKSANADDDLVSIGQGFCKMYDGGAVGADINKFILTAAGWAYTVPQLVAVHGAAVGAYCPQHESKMSQ